MSAWFGDRGVKVLGHVTVNTVQKKRFSTHVVVICTQVSESEILRVDEDSKQDKTDAKKSELCAQFPPMKC